MEDFGGLAGIRDRGLIESAIARPYCGYFPKIFEKAAALMHGLALNHGFVDGNKRTAIYAVAVLLYRSGFRISFRSFKAANNAMEKIVLDVVEHRMSQEDLARWFQERVRRASKKPRRSGTL